MLITQQLLNLEKETSEYLKTSENNKKWHLHVYIQSLILLFKIYHLILMTAKCYSHLLILQTSGALAPPPPPLATDPLV